METTLARHAGFVAVHTAFVAAYMRWLTKALPPLRDETADLVVVPVVVIAAIAFAVMHPLLRSVETHLARLAILALFTVIGILAYPLYFYVTVPHEPNVIGLFLLLVAAEVLYGLPMFLGVTLLAKATSRVLIGRPATSWV